MLLPSAETAYHFAVVVKLLVRRFKLGRLPMNPFSIVGLWKRLVFNTVTAERMPLRRSK